MKTILITGGLGFIGSEVVRQLYKTTDNKIIIIDNHSKEVVHDIEFEQILEDDSRVTLYSEDLTEEHTHNETTEGRIEISQCDAVICLAALIGGIGYFNKIPYEILDKNNKILSTVLKHTRLNKKNPHLIYISSSMVFENTDIYPTPENALKYCPVPSSAYGFSKLSGEYYVRAFADQYGLVYTILRPFNCVGESEISKPDFVGYSHLIPDIIMKIRNGQGTKHNPLQVLGLGNQVRTFTHVKDIAEAIILCINNSQAYNQDFNVASNDTFSVLEIVNLIWKLMRGDEQIYIEHMQQFKYDVQSRIPNINKIMDTLNWYPKLSLKKELPKIISSTIKTT